jgi:hypothetical protein
MPCARQMGVAGGRRAGGGSAAGHTHDTRYYTETEVLALLEAYVALTNADYADLTDGGQTALHKHDHGAQDGLNDDDHAGYALLAGRSGGQVLYGGVNSTDDLTLDSTAHATKGYLILQPSGGRVGIGRSTISAETLEIAGNPGLYIANAFNSSTGLNLYKRGATGDDTAAMASGAEIGYHSFYGWNGSAYTRAVATLVKAEEAWSSTATGSSYQIRVIPTGTTTAIVAIFIAPSGNVGIGTTSPKSKLHVTGLPTYANNAAAVAGGLTAGAFYRTGGDPDVVCVVH